MKRTALVSIIIINWNGEEIIGDCLTSLINQTYRNIEIIVLDNNSMDESIKKINQYPQVKIIRNKQISGFAEGNNIAVKKAKGEFILLFNSDAVAESINKINDFIRFFL
jgi:GT2 family glycosyltransferase